MLPTLLHSPHSAVPLHVLQYPSTFASVASFFDLCPEACAAGSEAGAGKAAAVVCYHYPCHDGAFAALAAHLHFAATQTPVRFVPNRVFRPCTVGDLALQARAHASTVHSRASGQVRGPLVVGWRGRASEAGPRVLESLLSWRLCKMRSGRV
jgi:hypothetical protein